MQQLGFFEYISLHMPSILKGLAYTCKLTVVVGLIMLPLSLLIAVAAISGPRWFKGLYKGYSWVFRGTPLLMQLYLAYYALPFVGVVLPANTVIVITFVLCFSAYQSEVFRGGLISVDKGQYEACRVLGMSYPQTMLRVVIPQTIRKVLPSTCSQIIVLFKDTSLVATIGVGDLLRSARERVILDLRIDTFAVVLVIYLLISSILVLVFNKLEKKYSVYV